MDSVEIKGDFDTLQGVPVSVWLKLKEKLKKDLSKSIKEFEKEQTEVGDIYFTVSEIKLKIMDKEITKELEKGDKK